MMNMNDICSSMKHEKEIKANHVFVNNKRQMTQHAENEYD